MHPVLEKWHEYYEKRDLSILNEILAEDATFYSPVVHTPQRGKMITSIYLASAFEVFGGQEEEHSFKYVHEMVSGNHIHLEFETEIDGIHINGIDMIEVNDEGKIINFKVMIRPLQGINKIHQKMGEMLKKFKG